MNKRELKKLARLMDEWFATVGATDNTERVGLSGLFGGCYHKRVETTVGSWLIHFWPDSGDIMTRFCEPERAHKVVSCNPYSGKWNFHTFREAHPAQDVFNNFVGSASRVL